MRYVIKYSGVFFWHYSGSRYISTHFLMIQNMQPQQFLLMKQTAKFFELIVLKEEFILEFTIRRFLVTKITKSNEICVVLWFNTWKSYEYIQVLLGFFIRMFPWLNQDYWKIIHLFFKVYGIDRLQGILYKWVSIYGALI